MIREKTFSVFGPLSMDVTDNELLLVRVKEEAKSWIRVMHRLTGELVNEIPSMCNHIVRVSKHPKDQDYAYESCLTCEEIYAHNINTRESLSVLKGSESVRMCAGPDGSLLVLKQGSGLHKLEWDKTQDGAQLVFVQDIARPSKKLLRLCYVECHDILMCTMKNFKEDQDYEIIAVKLGSETVVWRLSGLVDGCVIKPECVTCDPEGNAYVSDVGNNRILQINSLTGVTLSIMVLKDTAIRSMRWSDTEPNLTLRTENRINTYFVLK